MIEDVRMLEVINGNPVGPVFVFGENAAATTGDYLSSGMGTMETSAAAVSNKLRIVMDELLLGNYLEEIQCNGVVDSDAYAMVPVGATPDDIARCAVGSDLLPTTCPGSNPLSVCICQKDDGCDISGSSPIVHVMKGQSVGIKDINEDGSVDATRFIDGAVGIRCAGIDVAIDLTNSYWNPSGDQQKPAMGGFDALGPAIVLTPGAMPSNADCVLTFSPDVVDDTNIQVCAPPNGDVTKDCTPGDVSNFKFHTVGLGIKTGGTPDQGETGYDPNGVVLVYSDSGVAFDPTSLGGITVHNDTLNVDVTGFTTSTSTMNTVIVFNFPTGLAPSTMYTITFPTTITDQFGQPLPAPFVLTFTTGA